MRRTLLPCLLDRIIAHPDALVGARASRPDLSRHALGLVPVCKTGGGALPPCADPSPPALDRGPPKQVGFEPEVIVASHVARWVNGLPMPGQARWCFHAGLVTESGADRPTGNLNHRRASDSLKRLEGHIWLVVFKNIIIKTPLLAAEGFLILEIQIHDQFVA